MKFNIKIEQNEKLYLRDPEQSELGQRILSHSIELIESIGFEDFTFKKLAKEINTAEASVYRYFENKHKLLFYLISWYWAWIEYQIDYSTQNIEDPKDKLKLIIRIIAESYKIDPNITHINENLLHKIVVAEGSKVYLTKKVDEANRDGLFINYGSLVARISVVIGEINPQYEYPKSLASNLIETAQEQLFFAEHLPALSDLHTKGDCTNNVLDFLEHIAFSAIFQSS